MITLAEIEEEINHKIKDGEAPKDEKETEKKYNNRRKKAAKRVVELTHLKRYLQENPKPEDLQKQLEVLENKRNLINDPDNFDKWLTFNPSAKNDMKKAKAEYNKVFDLAHINSQIKTVKYLLQ